MTSPLSALLKAAGAALLGALVATGAAAQQWPDGDISLIVPYGPGGSTDALARQFSQQLEKILKVGVRAENKPGGSGTIGMSQVVRARPDGYTIGLGTNSILAQQPITVPGLPWKNSDDYQPIVKLIDLPNVLYVRADSPWKTFADFMADAKKNPGKIRVSVAALRGTNDLVMQQLNMLAGTKLTMVPFTGGAGEATIALLGGRVEAMAGTGSSNAGHVKSGQLRVLAAFQKGKYEPYPDAISIVDAGYEATLPAMFCVIAPKGLPKDVLDKLTAASLQVVNSDEWKKFARAQGSSPIEKNGPQVVKAEMDHYYKVYVDLLKFIDGNKAAPAK